MPRSPTEILQFAQQLRRQQTECERCLWQRVRSRQLLGFKFRRQYPFPPYILDFYCPELRLAIELDGGQHYSPSAQALDQRRTKYLEQHAIKIIRFSNMQVLLQIDDVLHGIIHCIQITPAIKPQRPSGVTVYPQA